MVKWLSVVLLFALAACTASKLNPQLPPTTTSNNDARISQVVQSHAAHQWQKFGMWNGGSPPTPDNGWSGGQMAADTSGNIWYIAGGGIGKMNYSGITTGFAFTWPQDFTIGTTGWGPGIAIAADHNIYVPSVGALVRLTPAGTINTFPNHSTVYGHITPGFGSDLWYVDSAVHHFLLANAATTTYAISSGENGLAITRGPDNNIWFLTANTINKVTLNGTITSYHVNGIGGSAEGPYGGPGIVTGPNDHLFTVNQFCQSYELTTSGSLVNKYALSGQACAPQLVIADGSVWSVGSKNPFNGENSNCYPAGPYYFINRIEINGNSRSVSTTSDPNDFWGLPADCLLMWTPPGETLGNDGNLYVNLSNGDIGVYILDSITVNPYVSLYTFSAPNKYLALTVSETNYTGTWSASSTHPTVVKVVKWLSKTQLQIESVGRGNGRIIIRDNKDNYYNYSVAVQ